MTDIEATIPAHTRSMIEEAIFKVEKKLEYLGQEITVEAVTKKSKTTQREVEAVLEHLTKAQVLKPGFNGGYLYGEEAEEWIEQRGFA